MLRNETFENYKLISKWKRFIATEHSSDIGGGGGGGGGANIHRRPSNIMVGANKIF